MYVILFWVVYMVVVSKLSYIKPEWNPVLIISTVVVSLVSLFLLYFLESGRCKNKKCRKLFAYDVVSRKLYKTRNTKKPVTKNELVYGRWEKVIVNEPATEYVYEVMEECRFCGHKRPRYESEIH